MLVSCMQCRRAGLLIFFNRYEMAFIQLLLIVTKAFFALWTDGHLFLLHNKQRHPLGLQAKALAAESRAQHIVLFTNFV